uniref:Uncharacterized protein n=1 Tax=Arundo donax TaxID=35708 RepID=A0A0A9G5G9_ARUDO
MKLKYYILESGKFLPLQLGVKPEQNKIPIKTARAYVKILLYEISSHSYTLPSPINL